jgi:hypothetical protein
MKHVALVAIVGLLLAGIGCDDKNSLPESVQKAAAKAQDQAGTPQRPTTRELVNGPKRRLKLTPIPFTARVPVSWKIENLGSGNLTILGGPTPSGEAQLQVTARSPATAEDIDIIKRASKKEMATTQSATGRHTIEAHFRTVGGIQAFERRVLGTPAPLIVTDDNNEEHTVTATPYTWTLTLFVPQGQNFNRYEINFIAMTREQYEQDKQVLEPIIDSLSYDPTALPATQPM